VPESRSHENQSAAEVLLVGDAEHLRRLHRWPVAAEVAPNVVIVRADLSELPEIAQHARVALGRRPDGSTDVIGDEGVLDELDEGARLFVTAWRERPLSKPDRPGEGLSWDAPGFEPPGPPRR
jgi:hypothetical protein